MAYLLKMNAMPVGTERAAARRRFAQEVPHRSEAEARHLHHQRGRSHDATLAHAALHRDGGSGDRADPWRAPSSGATQLERATRRAARARQQARRMALLGRRRVEHALLARSIRSTPRTSTRCRSRGSGTRAQYGEDEYYRTTPLYANGRLLTVATTRRKAFAIDPATGKTLWQWALDEGIRWQKAPRQFAGRGLAYWTDGTNERAIVITPGYHLASIDAKTGKGDPEVRQGRRRRSHGRTRLSARAARGGRLGSARSSARPRRRERRSPARSGMPTTKTGADGTMGIDPAHGQIAISSPAIVVGDVIIVGNSSMHGYYPLRLHNIPGFIRGFDVHTGKQLWKFNLIPQPGEFGAETWKNGSKIGTPGVGKNDAWAPYTRRSGARTRLHPGRRRTERRVRRPSSRQQSLREQHRRDRREDRQAQVALPDGAPRHLGLRHADGAEPSRRHDQRPAAQDHRRRRRSRVGSTCFDRVTGQPIWPMPETPVLQSEVPGEQTSPTQPIPTRPAPYAQQGLVDGRSHRLHAGDQGLGAQARAEVPDGAVLHSRRRRPTARARTDRRSTRCSWYAPGASGGVNIDGGTAADPETGMIYVGGQSGLGTIEVENDPCSEHRYSQPHNSCGLLGALPRAEGYVAADTGAGRVPASRGDRIGTDHRRRLDPQAEGDRRHHRVRPEHRRQEVVGAERQRAGASTTSNDPLFAGVTLPKVPALGGQAEVITTKTLVIHGTGRSGGPGGGRAGGRGGGGGAWRRSRSRRAAGDHAADLRVRQGDRQAGRRGCGAGREHGGADDVPAPGPAVHRVRDGRRRSHRDSSRWRCRGSRSISSKH